LSATSRLPKPNTNIMLPQTTSIWRRDSQPKASGRPGAVQIAVTAALTVMSAAAWSQVSIPPSGYSGVPGPDVAVTPEPGAPALTPVPAASLSDRLNVDPGYRRAALASVKIIGAYAIADRDGAHLIDAWSAGYLPVTLRFSDDRCFVLSADYNGPRLSNARIAAAANCD
ncbi:hypothetical protein U1737_19755, partial [Sphingomonas sp. LB3N6]|uniref:hypothetical protein n=1 Tax=Sphingomonas fucosidasi TaxID=3096164 RepID=UPI002FCA6B93